MLGLGMRLSSLKVTVHFDQMLYVVRTKQHSTAVCISCLLVLSPIGWIICQLVNQ